MGVILEVGNPNFFPRECFTQAQMLEFLFVVGPVRNWQKIYISNKNGQAYFGANENVFCKTVEIE